ncbi:SDR family NAD(P)-dependent oxidoreductase [uncultured Tolumonas sp.]|uniref:SDR family NAD(P)-dependent oxidoreductase n=1 Tax=uncultured Tolumonas sp. TaxID=263765 RepID=UPI0029309590|nr:SDR family NAD(P)-dependent oxidoreductase [uncultured Tolumonas sp.]
MKLAIISGGSKGLGHAIAEKLIVDGYQVVEFSRSAPHAYSIKLDFSAPDLMLPALSANLETLAAKQWDEIVVVSNAASLSPIGPTSKKNSMAVLANININFTSAILFMSEVIKHFQSHPCRKVVASISSGAALKAYSGWSLYCSAKAGLESYVRTVAVEQETETSPFVILNVDPGVMDTDMQSLIRSSHKDDFPAVDYFIHRKESGELRTPDQVAIGVVKILHSDAKSGTRIAVFS